MGFLPTTRGVQFIDKLVKTSSFRRKPESREAVQILRNWIPASAGMTKN